jgi:hypothetical protein
MVVAGVFTTVWGAVPTPIWTESSDVAAVEKREAERNPSGYNRVFDRRTTAVVLVTSETCPPCRRLEAEAIGVLRRTGLLDEVRLAVVRAEGKGAGEYDLRKGVPQVHAYRRLDGRMYRWERIGYGSPAALAAWFARVDRWRPEK